MVEALWDDRDWLISLKSDKPVDVYTELSESRISIRNAEKIEDLPKEQQDWLRAS